MSSVLVPTMTKQLHVWGDGEVHGGCTEAAVTFGHMFTLARQPVLCYSAEHVGRQSTGLSKYVRPGRQEASLSDHVVQGLR